MVKYIIEKSSTTKICNADERHKMIIQKQRNLINWQENEK